MLYDKMQHKAKLSAVFATRPHQSAAFYQYMVLVLICWFCVGGLIASALNLGLGEWIHKDAKQTN